MIDATRIESNWKAIQIEIDAPVPSLLERSLRRVGLSPNVTRIVAATPALRRSWFGALLLVIVVALAAADTTRPKESIFIFLLLAPVVPVLGVALSYGAAADSLHEVALASPVRGTRLLFLRTAAVLGISVPLLILTSLAAPAPTAVALSWLLPSAAVTSATLGLFTVLSPRRAAGATAAGWLALVTVVGGASGDRFTIFETGGQGLAAVVLVVGLLLTHQRRERLDVLGARS